MRFLSKVLFNIENSDGQKGDVRCSIKYLNHSFDIVLKDVDETKIPDIKERFDKKSGIIIDAILKLF